MNKDVIYIEPDDDITDIITKIENSKSKIVALVPPKKAGVFRSVVNIKLIAKAASTAKKAVVIVTTDPPILKLAAATKIPVAKNLQTAPVIPSLDDEAETVTSKEELREPVEEEEKAEEVEEEKEAEEEGKEEEKEEKTDDGEKEEEKLADTEEKAEDKKEDDNKPEKKKKRAKFGGNKFTNWVGDHKKLLIFGGVGFLVLFLVFIWAFVIAPAVTLTIGIKTEINNFSETIKFTTNLSEENADEGIFYLEEKTTESVRKAEFIPSGEKNIGLKASGSLVVFAYFSEKNYITIPVGSVFEIDGHKYVTVGEESAEIRWSTGHENECENGSNDPLISNSTIRCKRSTTVSVVAAQPGTEYNVTTTEAVWNSTFGVWFYTDGSISGGTDDIVTVVSEKNVADAKDELLASDQTSSKDRLLDDIDDDKMVIESSFSQTTEDPVSSPAIGEKVDSGKKAIVTIKTTAKIYTIDKIKVKEFIAKKARLGEGQKIYELRDPFIENFAKTETGYTGKLKASYASGPEVTENSVIEIVKGKGLGEAQHDLRDINGIISVTIDPSFPWVTTIPNDPNRITVLLEVKDNKSENP